MTGTKEWNGTVCGIITYFDPTLGEYEEDYDVGDYEICVMCTHEDCTAYVRPIGTTLTLEETREIARGKTQVI